MTEAASLPHPRHSREEEILKALEGLTRRALEGERLGAAEGGWLIRLDRRHLPALMAGADRIRRRFRGEAIEVCAIANVRSGGCPEDCAFCAQSAHHRTGAPVYNYLPTEEVLERARRARSWGVSDFGLVSKGWGVRGRREREQLRAYLEAMREGSDVGRCASLGALDAETARELKAMGLENYHHNLECAPSFFHRICSTHTYQENIDTIRHAREAGLRVCSGGILGMGESLDQRVELALTLQELEVESVPLNFLNPIPGTPLGDREPMQPLEILQTIAVFRYLLPRAEIRIAGGRQFLRDLQAMIFFAGASGVMIGDYLTTKGRAVEDDLQMLRDLGLEVREETQQRRRQEAGAVA